MSWFSDSHVERLPRTDRAGITVTWLLPRGSRRGQRGSAVGLNPLFPLKAEVRDLLRTLARDYDVRLIGDLTAKDLKTIVPNPRYDPDRLLGSRVRTRTLAALECLAGNARKIILHHSVPNEHPNTVKHIVLQCVRQGVLLTSNGRVSFAKTFWMHKLRKLLRAYAKLNKGFRPSVKGLAREIAANGHGFQRLRVLGKAATERILQALAREGPMPQTRLLARAHVHDPRPAVRALLKSGIIARDGAKKGSKIGLNALHPIYDQLRCYLLISQGLDPTLIRPLQIASKQEFGITGLFGTSLRLDVLVMIFLSKTEGVDGSDLARLLPQHDRRTMLLRIWDLAREGIVIEDDADGGIIRYRLDPAFCHYDSLTRLLKAITRTWPAFEHSYRLRAKLWPDQRQVRERNRQCRLKKLT